MAKEKSEKKEKKEKKEKRAETDGVTKKSKKDKKEKKEKSREQVEAMEKEVTAQAPATNGGAEDSEDEDVVVEDAAAPVTLVTAEKERIVVPKEALVPFANPLADDKQTKKVLKGVKKGLSCSSFPFPSFHCGERKPLRFRAATSLGFILLL